jgi:hypothetical protein
MFPEKKSNGAVVTVAAFQVSHDGISWLVFFMGFPGPWRQRLGYFLNMNYDHFGLPSSSFLIC